MSLKTALSRIFHRGKWAFQNLVGQSKLVKKTVTGDQNVIQLQKQQRLLKTERGSRFFSQNVKKYYIKTLAADLRRRAAWQFGNHVDSRLPILSFGFLGLALVNRPEQDDVISQTVRDMFINHDMKPHSERENWNGDLSVEMLDIGKAVGQGCNAAVYEAKVKSDFNHVVKVLFNFWFDTDAIIDGFRMETIPAECVKNADTSSNSAYRKLPPHPNIVEIQNVFVDQFPDLPDGRKKYPAALPKRLNDDGLGKDKTMFILMKKYTMTLRDYLNKEDNLCMQTRCILFTQLLEGVVHLRKHNIAHRDLKSDNILVDIKEDNTTPRLIISDFGCCSTDINFGLKIPYKTDKIGKGGIPALLAPEIASAVPGKDSWLNYDKADLWTVGTLVYELFGMKNPFMETENNLDCNKYKDSQLPRLPDEVPDVVKLLTKGMLKKDPKQRPLPEDAANLMQIYLWFPDWLNLKYKPSVCEVINSLLILAAKVTIGCHGDKLNTFDCLQETFLKRFDLCDIKRLLDIC